MGKIRSLFRRKSKSAESKSTTTSSTPSPPSTPTSGATTPTPSDDLTRVFNKFDSNGDGKISSSELSSIFQSLNHPLSPEELSRMMAEADSDGDGFISLSEFIDLNTTFSHPDAAVEDLKHAFSVFDLDRNGSISVDELARVLRSLGEGVSMAQCKKMIDGVDKDGDGMISFEEFKVMMTGSSSSSSSAALDNQ